MGIDPPLEETPVEVIIRAAVRRSRRPGTSSDRRTAESVLFALADTQLDRVAEHGFDSASAESLNLLRRHLLGGEDAAGVTATILRPDHFGGWACRLDRPIPLASARALASIARAFRGDDRFTAIAIEAAPWEAPAPASPRAPDATLGDRVIVLDRDAEGLDDLRDTARICAALRLAIMKRCPVQPVPEWIGGHRADGEALDRDHLACVALPQADDSGRWRLGAAALLVPREISDEAVRQELLPALESSAEHGPLRLWDAMAPPIRWRLHARRGGAASERLHESWWRGGELGARQWASVTPVVMDRHGSREHEQREAIERSCARLGLPAPIEVEVGRHSAIPGVPAAGSFPMSRREGRRPRQQWHVRVAFEQPVRGPIVLGAGRYRGHGLMMPIHETSGADHSHGG